MNEEIKRSKIYSYFYGANTVFQQILIVIGLLLLMLTDPLVDSRKARADKIDLYELNQAISQCENEYRELYYKHNNVLNVEYKEQASVSTDDEQVKNAQKEYNKALEKYEDAKEDYDKASEKKQKLMENNPFSAKALDVIGKIIIVAAALWIAYKKIAYNVEGEQVVDEELQNKIEEAKIKGLEKLNIVAEQIDKVEPVILNGVAELCDSDEHIEAKFKGIFGKVLRYIVSIDKFIIALIAAGALKIIVGIISGFIPFIIPFLATIALCGFVGYKTFIRYEKNSFVSPKKINKLDNFAPKFIAKLGSDDKVRVSLPAITVYMFGDEQIYMYYQYFDIVTGNIFCEGIHEYFYEDIVGITSKQERKKIFKRYGFLRLFLKRIDYLKESINILSKGGKYTESYIVDMGCSLLDTQFTGMRNLVRQKKIEK